MPYDKTGLVQETTAHLKKSNYAVLTDFRGLTVADAADLRGALREKKAEFHVVKNSILKVVAKTLEWPDLAPYLKGQTAVIVGGDDPSGVAKVIQQFFKEKEKLRAKGAVIDRQLLDAVQIGILAKLPPMEVLRAQLLSTLLAPLSGLVRLFVAAPQSLLNVLKAKEEKG